MRLLIGFVITILLLISSIKTVYASNENVAGTSASIAKNIPSSKKDTFDMLIKKKAIYNVLARYNSPLVDEADTFILACQTYNLDCYLLPSIAGLESGFGRALYPGTYNSFGWGGGMMYFEDWEESIFTVGEGLRKNYIDRGADNIYAIGRIYAPPSTTWASKVLSFMAQFQYEEEQLKKMSLSL